jgi:hypothetical protein
MLFLSQQLLLTSSWRLQNLFLCRVAFKILYVIPALSLQPQPELYSARGPSVKRKGKRGRVANPIKALEIDRAGCSYNPVRACVFCA